MNPPPKHIDYSLFPPDWTTSIPWPYWPAKESNSLIFVQRYFAQVVDYDKAKFITLFSRFREWVEYNFPDMHPNRRAELKKADEYNRSIEGQINIWDEKWGFDNNIYWVHKSTDELIYWFAINRIPSLKSFNMYPVANLQSFEFKENLKKIATAFRFNPAAQIDPFDETVKPKEPPSKKQTPKSKESQDPPSEKSESSQDPSQPTLDRFKVPPEALQEVSYTRAPPPPGTGMKQNMQMLVTPIILATLGAGGYLYFKRQQKSTS